MLLAHQTTERGTVLGIGPWDNGEFAVACHELGDREQWFNASNCETASELLGQDEIFPEIILLAEPLPAIYEQEQIEQLRRAAPLAQIVVVAGTWCEGELRTGKPLAGVQRLYWHELASWWQSRQQKKSTWYTSLDGPLAARGGGTPAKYPPVGVVAIRSQTLASFEAIAASLTDACKECVWTRVDSEVPPDVSVAIWDGGQIDPPEFAALQTFAAIVKAKQGLLIVLLDFPRKEHYNQLRAIGCAAVLGKPYIINELTTACGLAT